MLLVQEAKTLHQGGCPVGARPRRSPGPSAFPELPGLAGRQARERPGWLGPGAGAAGRRGRGGGGRGGGAPAGARAGAGARGDWNRAVATEAATGSPPSPRRPRAPLCR